MHLYKNMLKLMATTKVIHRVYVSDRIKKFQIYLIWNALNPKELY